MTISPDNRIGSACRQAPPRVRFAPSPTGQVHIGNIRTAIFNWLFARHCGGKFLLRIEDTDLERSTPEAIEALMRCLEWLELNHDEETVFQSASRREHLLAAERLLANGFAYRGTPDATGASPIIFRIPAACPCQEIVRSVGAVEAALHPEQPFSVAASGVKFFTTSKKGKPVETLACLAGFRNLKLFNAANETVFELDKAADAIEAGQSLIIADAVKMSFERREVFFHDLVKGELSKPLDDMRDLVIVRGDGTPVFHLANVCDDIAQRITHVIRGDDHVENTYRHLLLYAALDAGAPSYAHLPMIVNDQGKPYSKRDGDAFVGDFRERGFLAEALFNYLALLGWSPGDDREQMTRNEMIEAFTLERIKSAPARFDQEKLLNLNGLYISSLPLPAFISVAGDFVRREPWGGQVDVDGEYFAATAELMQSRTKTFRQVESWKFFFSDELEYGGKAFNKQFASDDHRRALEAVAEQFSAIDNPPPSVVMEIIAEAEKQCDIVPGRLFQPLRLAITGTNQGAELDATISLLGIGVCAMRIRKAIEFYENNRSLG